MNCESLSIYEKGVEEVCNKVVITTFWVVISGVEPICGAIQLCSSLEVIYVLFLNCCGARIMVINSRRLLVVLFTILIVEYFCLFILWAFPLHWRVFHVKFGVLFNDFLHLIPHIIGLSVLYNYWIVTKCIVGSLGPNKGNFTHSGIFFPRNFM